MDKLTLGFPRMHKEPGEVRDFTPRLVRRIAPLAREVVLEQGIGSGMGFTEAQYAEGVPNVRFAAHRRCYAQDVVVQVRAPKLEEMAWMQPGAILFAMLHFPTHVPRVRQMQEMGLRPVSMDGVVDDDGARIVEHLRGTSWNAVWAGFKALQKSYSAFFALHRDPMRVLIVGAGAVGRYAAEAAAKYGDEALFRELQECHTPGVMASLVDRSVTANLDWLKRLIVQSDILVDATSRKNTTAPIISNDLVGYLPGHAVVVDLAADPYNTQIRPIQVKGIEGIPTGNLDEYEFPPDHTAFDLLPPEVDTRHRRMTVSCYSWPGLKPLECMERYGKQVEPLLRVMLRTPLDELSEESENYFERALYRGTLQYYLDSIR